VDFGGRNIRSPESVIIWRFIHFPDKFVRGSILVCVSFSLSLSLFPLDAGFLRFYSYAATTIRIFLQSGISFDVWRGHYLRYLKLFPDTENIVYTPNIPTSTFGTCSKAQLILVLCIHRRCVIYKEFINLRKRSSMNVKRGDEKKILSRYFVQSQTSVVCVIKIKAELSKELINYIIILLFTWLF